MSKCSWWRGGHNFVTVAKAVEVETWCHTYQGIKLSGSDYTRLKPTTIERCTKCQELRAFDGYGRWPVSVGFAKKKIVELKGTIDDDLS